MIVTGTGVFTNVAATPTRSRGVQELAGDEITVSFIEADVKDVVRSLLGTTLRLPFVIDPRVQGTMTLQTSQPVPRRDALLLLESALRANGAALVESAGNYAVVPLADAPGQSRLTRFAIGSAERGQGFGVHVIPLRNISAPEMAKIAQPFLPADRILKADASRPLLIVAGTLQEVSFLLQLVNTFDVDWLKGVSFGMFPLETAKASDLAKELEAMVGTAGGGEREGASGPLAGMVKFVPVDRLNSILVVSQRPQYIAAIRRWIQALDKTKSSDTPRLYVYYPQNSKADALASTLGDIFSSGRGRSGPDFNVAPGQPGADLYSSPGGGGAGPLGGFGGGGFGGGGFGGGPGGGYGGSNLGRGISSQRPGAMARFRLAADTAPPPNRDAAAPDRAANPLLGPLDDGAGGSVALPTDKSVRIIANRDKNAIVVLATPNDYKMVEQAIQRLDVSPLQVVIEATIAEVTLTDNLRYGLEWFFKGGSSTITLSDAATGVVAPAAGFSYLLSASKAQLVINALSAVTAVNVVASPQILVLDNQTARLQVGDQVPIATQSAVQTITTTAPIVNSISYRDTGVILEVRPRVNNGGMVFLDISQEVSAVANTQTSSIDSPTIQQRRLRSTVAVPGGQTIALGGLIRDNRARARSGIPILVDLPLIGTLFGTRSVAAERTELLVMLTPHVIRNSEDMQAASDEMRRRVQQLVPVPVRR